MMTDNTKHVNAFLYQNINHLSPNPSPLTESYHSSLNYSPSSQTFLFLTPPCPQTAFYFLSNLSQACLPTLQSPHPNLSPPLCTPPIQTLPLPKPLPIKPYPLPKPPTKTLPLSKLPN